MGETKTIVCLANSRKYSGRCIAGKEILADGYGPWIRPVSVRQYGEISEEERRYENGVSAKLLDILRVPLIGAAPQLYQSENYLIDSEYYRVKKGAIAWRFCGRCSICQRPSGPMAIHRTMVSTIG